MAKANCENRRENRETPQSEQYSALVDKNDAALGLVTRRIRIRNVEDENCPSANRVRTNILLA